MCVWITIISIVTLGYKLLTGHSVTITPVLLFSPKAMHVLIAAFWGVIDGPYYLH